jgi:hypothetical protein
MEHFANREVVILETPTSVLKTLKSSKVVRVMLRVLPSPIASGFVEMSIASYRTLFTAIADDEHEFLIMARDAGDAGAIARALRGGDVESVTVRPPTLHEKSCWAAWAARFRVAPTVQSAAVFLPDAELAALDVQGHA